MCVFIMCCYALNHLYSLIMPSHLAHEIGHIRVYVCNVYTSRFILALYSHTFSTKVSTASAQVKWISSYSIRLNFLTLTQFQKQKLFFSVFSIESEIEILYHSYKQRPTQTRIHSATVCALKVLLFVSLYRNLKINKRRHNKTNIMKFEGAKKRTEWKKEQKSKRR